MASSSSAFETLVEPHRKPLRGYVFRMVGLHGEAEDLVQEVFLKAYERFPSLKDTGAFRSWLYQIATRTCIDHLRKQARWRPYSQRLLESACHADDALKQQVVEVATAPDATYEAREHIAFCFTCVSRSLEPEQQAALILREMLDLSNREAASVLGLSESRFRHLLAAGRRSMQDTFEGLCTLINKDGVCEQCASFRRVTRPEHQGGPLPILADDPETAWAERVRIAGQNDFADGVAARLHQRLFKLLDAQERAHSGR